MPPPKDMVERYVPLSSSQSKLHQLTGVNCIIFPDLGDGWVMNQWPNRHKSGNVRQWRKHDNRHRMELVPIDNALLEVGQVYQSVAAETERIAGGTADTGEHISGEVEKLQRQRIALGHWVTLTEVEKEDIHNYFADVANVRARAVNPLNILIAARAARMQRIEDRTGRKNPSAIMTQTHPLEQLFIERYNELVEVRDTNDKRNRRLAQWVFRESLLLGKADAALDRLMDSRRSDEQHETDMDSLMNIARNIRFRHQPFNQLKHAIGPGYEITDEALQTARQGLHFQRTHNYIASPFRRLSALTLERLESCPAGQLQGLTAATEERVAALQSMNLSGPYATLARRLIEAGELTAAAMKRRNFAEAVHRAEELKWLISYHCSGNDDPQQEAWYRYALYSQ